MMSDAELRTRIADVHRDDAPPSFAALTGRARPRRRAPVGLLAIAAAGGFLIVLCRPTAPPKGADIRVEFRDPLAFLLQLPGAEVIDSVPRFEGGELP